MSDARFSSTRFYPSLTLNSVVPRVEKEIKFSPRPETLRRLVTGVGEQIHNRDVYCGFPRIEGVEYPLIQQNAWLRRRNGEYELKLVTESNRDGGVKVSKEIPPSQVEDTLDSLLAERDVDQGGLSDSRLEPLVYVSTSRRRYTKEAETEGVDEFKVDLDRVRFWHDLEHGWAQPGEPDMTWLVGEIDITAKGTQAAKEEIDRVTTEYDLDTYRKRKVVTFFREANSDVYGYIPDS